MLLQANNTMPINVIVFNNLKKIFNHCLPTYMLSVVIQSKRNYSAIQLILEPIN